MNKSGALGNHSENAFILKTLMRVLKFFDQLLLIYKFKTIPPLTDSQDHPPNITPYSHSLLTNLKNCYSEASACLIFTQLTEHWCIIFHKIYLLPSIPIFLFFPKIWIHFTKMNCFKKVINYLKQKLEIVMSVAGFCYLLNHWIDFQT